ncbi:MAG: deoxyhypusine synthase family protein [Candidatus Aenigmatarchaeota archaeon]
MTNVKDFTPKKQTVDELVKQLKDTSFNARNLGNSVDILEDMIKDKGCVKFLGLSGALVPAGMRRCIVEMIRNKWINVIVSTGANITHDLAISLGGEQYIQCNPDAADDCKMRKSETSRIYDIASPDKSSVDFEEGIQKILKTIKGKKLSTYELMEEIGKKIEDENSIVKAAAENGVKIIIPAFFDSILGFQIWMYSQDNELLIDERKDLDFLINMHYDLKSNGKNSGALLLGGGVPKNYILQAVIIPDKPHKYVIQVTTDVPHYGGLSGASLDEAKSWGKVNEKSRLCCVYCDATIALPIMVSSLKERI